MKLTTRKQMAYKMPCSMCGKEIQKNEKYWGHGAYSFCMQCGENLKKDK